MEPRTVKKTARISPDRPSVGVLSILLVATVTLTAMAFSFAAIHEAARWSGAPEWVQWLAPIYIDGTIIAYTISLAILRWRAEHAHARSTLLLLRTFTGISVAINAAHTASFWNWQYGSYEMWTGIVISVLAPIASLTSAERLVILIFQQEASGAVTPDAEPIDRPQELEPLMDEDERATTAVLQPVPDPAVESEPEIELEPEVKLEAEVESGWSASAAGSLHTADQPMVLLPEYTAMHDSGVDRQDRGLLPIDDQGLFVIPTRRN